MRTALILVALSALYGATPGADRPAHPQAAALTAAPNGAYVIQYTAPNDQNAARPVAIHLDLHAISEEKASPPLARILFNGVCIAATLVRGNAHVDARLPAALGGRTNEVRVEFDGARTAAASYRMRTGPAQPDTPVWRGLLHMQGGRKALIALGLAAAFAFAVRKVPGAWK